MSRPVITLTTDYGPASEHVGALHVALAAAAPDADRIDLAHDIAPGEIRWGAIVLARLVAMLPAAVHLAVVDPGVGGRRRAVAVATTSGGYLVGPDNGLLGLVSGIVGAVELQVPNDVPATFHGRDVFAPAAARLANGTPLHEVGVPIERARLVCPPMALVEARPGYLASEVALWDRFGNVQLLATGRELDAAFAFGDRVAIGTTPAVYAETFGDVDPGKVIIHTDSHGHVAIAVNRGDAVGLLGLRCGSRVEISG